MNPRPAFLLTGLWMILFLGGLGLFSPTGLQAGGNEGAECFVVKVMKGDTLSVRFLNGQAATIRLVGVGLRRPAGTEAPPPLEKEALAFVTQQLSGQRVRVDLAAEKRDSFFYPFVYLFLPDGSLLNAELIKKGYAFASDEVPFAQWGEFQEYEREAKEAWRGMWRQKIPPKTDAQPHMDIFLDQD
ncbi:MAG: thermonuclease family protein [Candidatus Tectomicrobia bacterium]|uniref:Thermonuclease family protein n=1 Tax=Tectimicrobiota bacterium TaxID=2528274 RepID=A0A932CP65_UNCTE|nr:thermonuclease family protein [Candidatus Tectomicrobia bacterium]